MFSKHEFGSRPRPLCHRILEGITSFSLPLGFLIGGGEVSTHLFLFYILHAMSSLLFHLFPTETNYWLDTSFINLMIMERLYLQNPNLYVYLVYLTSMLVDGIFWEPHWGVIARAIVGIIIMMRSISIYHLCLWVVCLLTFLQSMNFMWKNDVFHTTLTCCLYHLYLGLLSCVEVRHYVFNYQHSLLEQFGRYCGYLFFVSIVLVQRTTNPKRLRSVLSFITSIVLTPLSFYQLWRQFQSPDQLYRDDNQSSILLFYIAYCMVDMVFGYTYYPQYFGVLDGWAHHIGTASFALYFLREKKEILFCIGLVLETSSILLFLSRIFYDVEWVWKLKARYFYTMFLWFRIILPTFFMVYFYPLTTDPACLCMYALSTTLNSYWICRFKA